MTTQKFTSQTGHLKKKKKKKNLRCMFSARANYPIAKIISWRFLPGFSFRLVFPCLPEEQKFIFNHVTGFHSISNRLQNEYA